MFEELPANTYLVLLIMLQIIMLIFSYLGQFTSGMYFMAMRIIFLILAQCCKRPRSAAFYSVLALMNGFYAFDPVGLFITGHGQHRTFAANIFCVLACFLAFIASYLGYLYKIALERDNPENQDQVNGQNPAFLYNGNNTGYMNPNDRQNPNPYAGNNARNFMPFQGQGYALG